MDSQFQSDLLLAMAVGFGFMMIFRFWPRIQAKLMGIPFISADEAKRRMDDDENVLVIDVRTADEFTGTLGHIEGALNLEAGKLHQKLLALGDDLDPYKTNHIIVACRTQNRSPKAARLLFQSGFGNLAILDGGMMGWGKAGYPVSNKG